MFNLLHTFHPQPIALMIGGFTIRWYGVFMALGALLGILAAAKLAERYKITKDEIYNLAFYLIIFGLLGARLYYVLYGWQYYISHPLDIFKIWQGGLAIYGAIIGGAVTVYYFAKKEGIDFWRTIDVLVIGLLIGQILGRLGNYFNQELFGKPTDLPWGIPIDSINRPTGFSTESYFHPTFLYEILLNLLLLGGLLLIHKINISRGKRLQSGTIALSYLMGYSLIRFFTETLRTDSTPFIFGVRWQMMASIILLILAVGMLIFRIIKKRK
ncbi:MAG: prolipoprotein diacylglyceryl transferase [Janthinobacterium sp.]|jgi:phosphatidylglycerol:prolipoprotein diacylglycerol transferase